MRGNRIKIGLIVAFILMVGVVVWLYINLLTPCHNSTSNKASYLYIYTNKSLEESFDEIQQNNTVKHLDGLLLFAKITGYYKKIKPGRYAVEEGLTNLKLLRRLTDGRQTPLNVTLLYAQRVPDLVSVFGQKLEVDSNELLHKLTDSIYLASLGFNANTVMALFIPNTYNFYWTTNAEKLIERMQQEYTKFWTTDRKNKADSLSLTPIEVATLASIVQKETNKVDEMPIIAGAYLNRLKIGMPLQADPTLIFALNNNQIKRVGGSMLKTPSAYNTYINKGLPPGPICMASVQAINAVLNAAKHNYIYFCARADFSGYHAFASSFSAHQTNARAYQKALNLKGIR